MLLRQKDLRDIFVLVIGCVYVYHIPFVGASGKRNVMILRPLRRPLIGFGNLREPPKMIGVYCENTFDRSDVLA